MSGVYDFDRILTNKTSSMFDLDGTLIDSMWVWDRLLIDFLKGYNYEASDEVLSRVAHMTLLQSSAYVKQVYDLPVSAGEIRRCWNDMVYDGYAHKIKPKNGAPEYLEKLKRDGKKVAVATACSKELAKVCLKNNDMYDLIDVFTYADEVGTGKRAPDVYIECLRRLGSVAAESVLFEDILVALNTAKRIGLSVVIVEDGSAEKDRDKLMELSDKYIIDFTELM